MLVRLRFDDGDLRNRLIFGFDLGHERPRSSAKVVRPADMAGADRAAGATLLPDLGSSATL